MLYNTGTIAINGNTATGTGTNWTAPASQVRAGQTIIVMSDPVQMFQISSVNSGTSLTVTPAASPALSGQKYGILVSDNISVDGLAQAISQLINEYDENIGAWEAFATTSSNQSITVTINGTAVTIPGIGKLLQKGSNGALAVADGGTGATTKEDARTNLGLGSAATRNAYSTSGDLLSVGDFGMGTESPPNPANSDANNAVATGVYYANGGSAVNYFSGYTALLTLSRLPTNKTQIQANASGVLGARALAGTTWSPWVTHYSTANTTKASDGTLKAASPVARIVNSHADNERSDVDEEGYTWCGCGTANAEAEGISISRLDVGVYVLTGSAGLASEGWQILPPMDPGGMGELGVVEAEQTESGGITIRLFRRKYMLGDEGEIVKTKGQPLDVPANSWIDVRLDMPEDSLYNVKLRAATT
ncbi:phage tail protein [Enterobacter oligotrophicus]|uniref:pyocin knob domain-containing protein n=1 Tax=Enterobacter oligotrophicus TaxID=2478464 RepID=UPI001C009BBD|nr:pyocin knob domain-containing protein [Enterobacter oligotrophicus]MBT9425837.1 phage tail protein [Enterobacter oligotrophicus]